MGKILGSDEVSSNKVRIDEKKLKKILKDKNKRLIDLIRKPNQPDQGQRIDRKVIKQMLDGKPVTWRTAEKAADFAGVSVEYLRYSTETCEQVLGEYSVPDKTSDDSGYNQNVFFVSAQAVTTYSVPMEKMTNWHQVVQSGKSKKIEVKLELSSVTREQEKLIRQVDAEISGEHELEKNFYNQSLLDQLESLKSQKIPVDLLLSMKNSGLAVFTATYKHWRFSERYPGEEDYARPPLYSSTDCLAIVITEDEPQGRKCISANVNFGLRYPLTKKNLSLFHDYFFQDDGYMIADGNRIYAKHFPNAMITKDRSFEDAMNTHVFSVDQKTSFMD